MNLAKQLNYSLVINGLNDESINYSENNSTISISVSETVISLTNEIQNISLDFFNK